MEAGDVASTEYVQRATYWWAHAPGSTLFESKFGCPRIAFLIALLWGKWLTKFMDWPVGMTAPTR
jgi:hypothetical protein